MSAWVVVPCLLTLRNEFNAISPNRDKGADGTIGNSLHTSSSDHTPDEDSNVLRDHDPDSKNEVHALDIDSSGPWPAGRSFKSIVMGIIAGEKAKWKNPNDKCRLNYVIYDGYIYDKDNDFNPKVYSASSDPHTNHAHFSSRYETVCENDTRPWGVKKEEEVALDATDIAKIADAVWDHKENNPATNTDDFRMGGWARTEPTRADARRDAILAKLTVLTTAVSALTSVIDTDDDDTDAKMAQLQQQLQELKTSVSLVPGQTVEQLFDQNTPDQELADTLKTLLDGLGETRKANVLSMLNG